VRRNETGGFADPLSPAYAVLCLNERFRGRARVLRERKDDARWIFDAGYRFVVRELFELGWMDATRECSLHPALR